MAIAKASRHNRAQAGLEETGVELTTLLLEDADDWGAVEGAARTLLRLALTGRSRAREGARESVRLTTAATMRAA